MLFPMFAASLVCMLGTWEVLGALGALGVQLVNVRGSVLAASVSRSACLMRLCVRVAFPRIAGFIPSWFILSLAFRFGCAAVCSHGPLSGCSGVYLACRCWR